MHTMESEQDTLSAQPVLGTDGTGIDGVPERLRVLDLTGQPVLDTSGTGLDCAPEYLRHLDLTGAIRYAADKCRDAAEPDRWVLDAVEHVDRLMAHHAATATWPPRRPYEVDLGESLESCIEGSTTKRS